MDEKQAVLKCHCECIEQRPGGVSTVQLCEVSDASVPAEKCLAEDKPWGSMKLTVTNPNLVGFFEAGKHYLVTIDRDKSELVTIDGVVIE